MPPKREKPHITGKMLSDDERRTGDGWREIGERYGLTYNQARYRALFYRKKQRKEKTRPYGATRNGCNEGCPHWERCCWLIEQRAGVLCEVPVGQVTDAAATVDRRMAAAMAREAVA